MWILFRSLVPIILSLFHIFQAEIPEKLRLNTSPSFSNYQISGVSKLCTAVSLNGDEEIQALTEFQNKVDGMFENRTCKRLSYLSRWLKAYHFDINTAHKMLENAIIWRKENKIDKILNEDFSSIWKSAPHYLDGKDMFGRPILSLNPGRWDIRRLVLSNELPRFARYLDQIMEKGAIAVANSGENITQGIAIFDMEGYSLITHGCIQCIRPLFNWIRNYELYYPGLIAELHIINSSRIFSPLLSMIKPLMSAGTRQSIRLHGSSKVEWKNTFLKTIQLNQIRRQFGGTKSNMG